MTCEQRIIDRGEYRLCGQTVGLTHWWDISGREHRACHLHLAGMQRRWTPGDAPWPGDLPDHAPDATVESEHATYITDPRDDYPWTAA